MFSDKITNKQDGIVKLKIRLLLQFFLNPWTRHQHYLVDLLPLHPTNKYYFKN